MEPEEVDYQRYTLGLYKEYNVVAPYKVLCEQEFLEMLTNNKLLTSHMNKVLGENRALYTPRCAITKPGLGVEKIPCLHTSGPWEETKPIHCINKILGDKNPDSYIVATRFAKRGRILQKKNPTIPVMIGNANGTVSIMGPSTVKLKAKKKRSKARMADNERAQAKSEKKEAKKRKSEIEKKLEHQAKCKAKIDKRLEHQANKRKAKLDKEIKKRKKKLEHQENKRQAKLEKKDKKQKAKMEKKLEHQSKRLKTASS